METLTQIKDRVAKKHGFDGWRHMQQTLFLGTTGILEITKIENETIQEYANTRCIRQRELCAKAYEDDDDVNIDPYTIILTAKLATEE